MGAARPTAVQSGGVDVFERSDDHVEGPQRSLHAQREDSAFLNQYSSFGALDKRSAPRAERRSASEA